MANIKSAKKRILVNRTKAARNKSIKSAVKTSIKKVEAAVAASDKEAANAALLDAISSIDKAASKGVYHKNNASRKVSRLSNTRSSVRIKHRNMNPGRTTVTRPGFFVSVCGMHHCFGSACRNIFLLLQMHYYGSPVIPSILCRFPEISCSFYVLTV